MKRRSFIAGVAAIIGGGVGVAQAVPTKPAIHMSPKSPAFGTRPKITVQDAQKFYNYWHSSAIEQISLQRGDLITFGKSDTIYSIQEVLA